MIFNVGVQPQKSHRKVSEGPSSDFLFRKNDHREREELLLPVTELHACALGHPELESSKEDGTRWDRSFSYLAHTHPLHTSGNRTGDCSSAHRRP